VAPAASVASLRENGSLNELRGRLEELAREYSFALSPRALEPGVDYLPPSGKMVGADEFALLVQAAADLHLTAGRFAAQFEEKLAALWRMKRALLVNSGSSANLLAFATLTSPALGGRAIKRGDEVITAACGFPTTVAPIVQFGSRPVFVDVDLHTQSPTLDSLEAAITPRTKAIMLAHPLGNPFRADEVAELCRKRGLWLVEDCCDALGATIGDQNAGAFGDLATCSFYPAHHLTMGEGGALLTNDIPLHKIALSVRDWGRHCWCAPGDANTCQKRFGWQLGELPKGYDHKYTYSHLGYNLKSTDFQAAAGLAQLDKVEGFIKARRENHESLTDRLKDLGLDREFWLPQATPGTRPSWFGYLLILKESGRRRAVIDFLEANKVGTRLLFGGNLTRQPALEGVDYRVEGTLDSSDKLMNDAFWVGIWPGLGKRHMDYIAKTIATAARGRV
jgi:CDP-6-deoxy-D-xylo-4-hexulose-3-dehydrase